MNSARLTWIFICAFLSLWSPILMALPNCRYIPENSNQALATVCESDGNLNFDFSGEKFTKEKSVFLTELKSAIESWMHSHQLQKKDLTSNRIRIWLSVPDSDPTNAQGRVEIALRSQNVVLSFNPKNDVHIFEDDHVGILGTDRYPNAYGWRPTAIILRSNDKDEAQLYGLASEAGIEIAEAFAKNWYYGRTSILNEQNARQDLLRLDPQSQVVLTSQLNQVVEWIGYRGQILESHW